jgi:glycosyltransferase involved in cell wall biosynthesis
MKLLIVTQVIDMNHPVLGFFHRWVEEFAVHCEHVHVICLQKGVFDLPTNVTVHSLGKEDGVSTAIYLLRFYKNIWQLRHDYDSVFVHMNQLYVILGAPLWRLLGKRIGLWYMHGSTSFSLKIAEIFTHSIYTGSTESFRLKSNKVRVTGHGIDTKRFAPQNISKTLDLITVGRITKSKNLLALIDVLKQIRLSHQVALTIVGVAITSEERAYEALLTKKILQEGLKDFVHFKGKISQAELPTVLNQAKVFVTTAQNGSLDKAVLEALSCGLPVISMAPGSASLPLGEAQVGDISQFVAETKKVLESGVYLRDDYVDFVRQNHSLSSLIPKILH